MIIRLLAVCAAFLLAPIQGVAQEFDFQAVMATGTTGTLTFDAQYEQSKGSEVPLYFTVQVPIADGLMRVKSDTSKDGHYTDLSFATMGGAVAETLELREATMGPGTDEERSQWLADMIRDQIYPSVTQGIEGINLIGVRKAVAGPYQAVELVAIYKLDGGDVAFRIMGIFPPAGEQILLAMSHTVVRLVPMEKTADLAETMAGTTLNSMRFTAARGADGALSSF